MASAVRLQRSLLLLTGLAAAAACRSPEAPSARGSARSTHPPAIERTSSRPRAVLQPRFPWEGRQRFITPKRIWITTRENGVTVADGERNVGLASFFATLPSSDIALTEDGEDAIVLLFDPRYDRRAPGGPATGRELRILERWNLATRTRRWSLRMPAPSKDVLSYGMSLDHVTVSAQGVFVTRCLPTYQPQNTCTVWKVDAMNGALGPSEVFSTATLPSKWGEDRIDAKNNRFSLRQPSELRGKPRPFWIFDATGRVRGAVTAICARFDEQDTLWLEGAVEASLQAARGLGLNTLYGPRACVSEIAMEKPLPMSGPEKGVADQSYPVISGNRVVWQLLYGMRQAFSLDMTAPALPARFELPPENDLHIGSFWELQRSNTELYAAYVKNYARWPEGALAPEIGVLPRAGFLWSRGGALLLGYWPPSSAAQFKLTLGTRPRPDAPLKWRELAATSVYTPGFTLTEQGGKPVLVVAGGKSGLQRVDAASGQLLSRTCGAPTNKNAPCSSDEYIGLAVSRDRATAWTYNDRRDASGSGEPEFQQIDLGTGSPVRAIRAPRFSFDSSDGYKMGWLEPDQRFWFAAKDYHYDFTCAAFVSVPPAPRVDAAYDGLCLTGRPSAVEGDPGGRFFASFRVLGTVDFIAPDGEQVLLVGVRNGGDALAQTRDGRFACTGAACDELRCVVGDEARPISDAACAPLRAPGFSLLEELAKPRR